jgi:hypothetical protein
MRLVTIACLLLSAGPVLAMQQTAPPMPKVQQPWGWPLVGYILAALLLVGGVLVSVRSPNRKNLDESGAPTS